MHVTVDDDTTASSPVQYADSPAVHKYQFSGTTVCVIAGQYMTIQPQLKAQQALVLGNGWPLVADQLEYCLHLLLSVRAFDVPLYSQ